jgi:hypothetical protein
MGRKTQRIQIIVVIVISIFVPITSDCFCHNCVTAFDFSSPNPTFETLDQECLAVDYEIDLRPFGFINFFDGFQIPIFQFERSPEFWSRTYLLDPRTAHLRC